MSVKPSIDDAIEHIYAASCDPAEWPAVTERCRAFFPGASFSFLIKASASYDPLSATAGWDPYWLGQYWTHFHKINPYERLLRDIPAGKVVRASHLVTKRWLHAQPFFHEWLKPAGGYTHGAGVTLARSQGSLARLTYDLSERLRHLEAPAAGLLQRLAPHFMRALDVASRTGGGRLVEGAFQALIDRLTGAVFAITPSRRILHVNSEAEVLLEQRMLVRESPSGFLAFLHHQGDERLQLALASCTVGSVATYPTTFAVHTGDRQHTVHVLPLRVPQALTAAQTNVPVLLVLIGSDEAQVLPPAALLKDLYGLSQKEAAVVLRVAHGSSIVEAAAQLGVTAATARNQLASAMSKLGVHRRAELVALLAGIVPRIKVGVADA